MKIEKEFLQEKAREFNNNRALRISQRAASSTGLVEASIDKREYDSNRFHFNISLPETKIRNQNKSGRCWIFAAMNVLEYALCQKYNLKEFELSQTYIYFYDKLERANYFFNSILETLDEEPSSRLVSHILLSPMGDGGQWDMIKNIVKKYGVVPANSMPDTANSTASANMNDYLTKMLRMYAKNIRKAHQEGKSLDDLRAMVEEYMGQFYNALAISLGTPPEKIDFEARDKDDQVHSEKGLSPLEFFNLIDFDLDQYISLINAPTKDKPYYKSYTVEHLGNVLEGDLVKYVNVPIEIMKEAVVDQIRSNEPVWFGCDVGQFFSRKSGKLDLTTVNVFDMLDVDYDFSKEERLDYHESLMTHAMVFTGLDYDMENEKPLRYKVENSWGSKSGIDGYLVMSDEWFEEYMYQVLVNKAYLPEEVLVAYEEEPIRLRPWDPMGSLA